jgi:3-dehydrosphinganine reductase
VYKESGIDRQVFAQSCDVTDFDAVQRAVDAANAFHERVTDHIVCCAGYIQPGYFLEQDVRHMERSMDVNYFGTLHTIRAALPAMMRTPESGDRRLVLVGSGLSLIAWIGTSQYSASKFALRGLAEALRNELKTSDIRISIFYAGNIDTEGFREEQRLMPAEGKIIEGVSIALPADKAAQQMIDGIARGDFSITNDSMIFLLRVLANGVVPRFNSPLELVVLPLLVPVGVVFYKFMDTVVWWSRRSRKRRRGAGSDE